MRGNSCLQSKKKGPFQGQKEVSVIVNIIRNNELQVKVDSGVELNLQPLLFPETKRKQEPMIATKKAQVLQWLRKSWSDFGLSFTKAEAASLCAMSKSEFAKALWSLKEDGHISYFFRRSFKDYLITGIEKEASDE